VLEPRVANRWPILMGTYTCLVLRVSWIKPWSKRYLRRAFHKSQPTCQNMFPTCHNSDTSWYDAPRQNKHERENSFLSLRKLRLRPKLTLSKTSTNLATLIQIFLLRKFISRLQILCNLTVRIYLHLNDFSEIFFNYNIVRACRLMITKSKGRGLLCTLGAAGNAWSISTTRFS